jgi:CDP-diacylglycerol--glycerol-3-phosphate 3-phosphatidyltransferase
VIRASQIPNIISALRITSCPVLLLLAYGMNRPAFAWLLAAALISDILDGAIARHFGFVSQLGSLLDSIGDILLFIVAAYGVWQFHPELVHDHSFAFVLVLVLWIGGSFVGYLRYGRLASFHTLLARITAYVIGAFIGLLFLWGFHPWLFWSAVALVVISQAEEFILMAILPQWTPNVGGLYWVLKKRTSQG